MKHRILFLLLVAAVLVAWAGQPAEPVKSPAGACPLVKLKADSLPPLNTARAGHRLFYANGELTVAGGHTNGFVPTPTAEYLKDGRWHQLPMVYNHDVGFHVVLRSGKVLLGGGSAEPIGIGQTFLAELYDPVTHTFDSFNSMEHKRAMASALELDSGRVVISGNWYHQDAIEVYDTLARRFIDVRETGTQRAVPVILQTAPDDALILGSSNNRGDTLRSAYVYQLKGDSLHIPLLETWQPILTNGPAQAIGKYTYLIPVQNRDSQTAIMQVQNGLFTLLPTTCPVPMRALGHQIEYAFNIIVDRKARRAYLMGFNRDFHGHPGHPIQYYILAIDYAGIAQGQAARLTLYYTQPINEAIDAMPQLTPEGHLVAVGGLLGNSNFTPSRMAWLFPVGESASATACAASMWRWRWWWTAPITGVLAVALCLVFLRLRRRHSYLDIHSKTAFSNEEVHSADTSQQLMERIQKLIEHRQLYLDSNLKVTDIANVLHLHRNDISACINTQKGCTFSQYINNYRIDYAKRLMRQQPGKKITTVWMEAGFGSEQNFFKTFRAATGLSPKEWMEQQGGK